MKEKKLISLTSMLFLLIIGLSQTNSTVSGYVLDSATGEALIGAYVYELNSNKAATTNVYGFYSLTLPSDSIKLFTSYIGYSSQTVSFNLVQDISRTFDLNSSLELSEAVVESSQSEPIQNRTQMSSLELDMRKVKSLPVLLGETDVLKTLQLLPGIQSGTEGASGIYVRGGGPDQNLMLLDGVPIYNASHLFGFFSVFNADAIRDVKLIKGGFPARYGGRLSSVIDVRMKEGNLYETHGEVSVGIVAAKLSIEGPIKKEKSSFLFSARRTYIDALTRPLIKASAKQSGESATGGYYFYDLNGKINYIISNKDRLFLSGYFGNDRAFAKYSSSFGDQTENIKTKLEWGNAIVAARWNHVFSPKLFSNTTLTYSKYKFLTAFDIESGSEGMMEEISLRYDSGIDDYSIKTDFEFIPNPDLNLKFGLSFVNHKFTPGVSRIEAEGLGENIRLSYGSNEIRANELNAYTEADWKLGDRFKVNLGVHSSNFFVEGESYFSIQPRISSRYLLNKKSSIKASYANMTQFLHLLSNSTIGLPTDLWVPVTEKIKPQTSDQLALGYAVTPTKGYQISVEGYYKWMNNLIEYKDGASFQGSAEDWQDKVEVGKGWSYGAEFLLEKTKGDFTGWIGYTLSWTNREFENINFGDPFPYRFDRRHDIGVALTYEPSERIDYGLVFVYGTGNAVTLPVAKYNGAFVPPTISGGGFEFQELEYISERNGYRTPSYHRLDLGVNFHKEVPWGKRTWSLGFYNIYSRQNPFFLFFDQEYNESEQTSENVLKQISLFPIIPSISYAVKF
jgi:hypothetical protein